MKEEQFGSIRFLPGEGFPLSTDSVLLSAFVRCPKSARVCDLGAGSGALSLLLLSHEESLHCTGIELQQASVAAAEENIRRNELQEHMQMILGDLRNIRQLVRAGSFSCAVSNPPYFPSGSGAVRDGEAAATATSEATCTMAELFSAADWALQWGGKFSLVHRSERLADLMVQARAHRLEPKRLRYVCHHPGKAPNLLLLECVKGGKPGLVTEPTLYLFDENGHETAETRKIYRKED